ncbi:MAG: hemolysin family protein [Clostridiales bacterium]
MDILNILLNVLTVLILVLINGFFVAVEFALVKVRDSKMTQLVNEGNKMAVVVKNITKNLDSYLSACQLGITLASLGLGWVGEPFVASAIEPILKNIGFSEIIIHTISFALAFSIITMLHIVLGELAPKSIAIQKSEKTALLLALPLKIFFKLTYPLIWILNIMSNLVLKIIGLESVSESDDGHSEEELKILVRQSSKNGLIDKSEGVLFDKFFNFKNRVAKDSMVPRTNAIILDAEDSYETNLNILIDTRHTRYPVCNGNKDEILGFVHVSDFYAESIKKENKNLKSFLREILKVPESLELSDVMKLMKKNKTLIAIVVDEFGGTAGIITFEDMIEEILGEIQDEFDNERPPIEKIENGYLVDGLLLIEEVNNLLKIDITNEDVNTIAGWIHMLLIEDPQIGKKIEYDNFVFEISEMEKNRISRIYIAKI